MICESVHPATDADGMTIDMTGITGLPGSNPVRQITDWTLNDYLISGVDISFVVHSWEAASDYTLTVTCQ
jgi:hypothetical protein